MNSWGGRRVDQHQNATTDISYRGGGLGLARVLRCASLTLAAASPAWASDQPAAPTQRVEVIGTASGADRRDANVSKIIVSQQELLRFGDTNLVDALRRVPAVSIAPGQGRTSEIRLRGLGAGYTQVLLNGEPAPAGFSIDSLSPDIVERVEIVRSASAESSTQSIAGSINIVLRRQVRTGQRDVRLQVASYTGLGSATASGQIGQRDGNLSYSLAANLNVARDRWPSTTTLSATDNAGAPLYARSTQTREDGRRLSLGLTPRATWQLADSRSLSVDGLLQVQRFDFAGTDTRTGVTGTAPGFDRNDLTLHNSVLLARLSSQLKADVSDDSRIELKLTLSHFRRVSDSRLDGFDSSPEPVLVRNVDSLLQDGSLAMTGKYTVSISTSHSFSTGWELQRVDRAENRIQRETSATGRATENLDEDYEAVVTRLAAYFQDDWQISDRVSAYLGLRWEGLLTRTQGNSLAPVRRRSGVFSPTFQWLWKIPESKSDQLRVSLARTYKAPTARELIPRRWVVTDNNATSPDFQGNPDLAPELAWGVDVGYERHLAHNGFFGVSAYVRDVRDVILQRTFFGPDGNWISSPSNSGNAIVRGIEVEARSKLRALWAGAGDVDVRAGLTRNLSRVQQVPSPGNRLSQQPSLTVSLGADYRPAQTSLTLGANFSFEKGDFYRSSQEQSGRNPYKRNLDAYGLWTLDKDTRIRLSLANLLRASSVTTALYDDASLHQVQRVGAQSFVTVRLGVELRL